MLSLEALRSFLDFIIIRICRPPPPQPHGIHGFDSASRSGDVSMLSWLQIYRPDPASRFASTDLHGVVKVI